MCGTYSPVCIIESIVQIITMESQSANRDGDGIDGMAKGYLSSCLSLLHIQGSREREDTVQ